ncbi:MAG: 30S ribosomal protein S16 [Acidimicrobiia bacterium]
MAVKMRLMRMGKKKQPQYRVVVIDGRAQRDGRYIEQIGRYAPLEDPSLVEIDNDKAAEWLAKGAQPTEAVEKLLNISGAMNTMKVRTGQIHTIGTPAPPSADEVAEEAAAEADADETVTEEAVAEPAEEAGEVAESAETADDADGEEE